MKNDILISFEKWEENKMKVLLVNGGPHKEGCTYTALSEVAKELNKEGIETEIFWNESNVYNFIKILEYGAWS